MGQNSGQFREVTLSQDDIANLNTMDPNASYDGDGELLKVALDAYTLGIAHEFDPYFGLSISRVDPLPHQLEAVYEYFMLRRHQELGLPEALLLVSHAEHAPLPRSGAPPTPFPLIIPTLPSAYEGFLRENHACLEWLVQNRWPEEPLIDNR